MQILLLASAGLFFFFLIKVLGYPKEVDRGAMEYAVLYFQISSLEILGASALIFPMGLAPSVLV